MQSSDAKVTIWRRPQMPRFGPCRSTIPVQARRQPGRVHHTIWHDFQLTPRVDLTVLTLAGLVTSTAHRVDV